MSTRKEREKAVKAKWTELRQLSQRRVEVHKSIWEFKKSYAELTRKIDTVKGEIRLLGAKVPVGSQYADRLMLGHLIDGRASRDLRP
jgi:hypothetical protein